MSSDLDEDIGQRALSRGWITGERLAAAAAVRENERSEGRGGRSLGTILVDLGHLTAGQLAELRDGRAPAALIATVHAGKVKDAGVRPSGEAPIRKFGEYEILAELGRGGMGVVYKARQPGLDRVVALKTLLAMDLSDEAGVERFLAEAKTLARLKHPGIVPLFDWGRVGDNAFFTMQLLEGISLHELLEGYGAVKTPSTTLHEMVSEVLRNRTPRPAPAGARPARRPLPLLHALALIRKVLDALGYAHEAGVIHRDLKPSNVMVTNEGEVVLMDFGLARAKAGSTRQLTVSGAILGTPAYMAPEQARGDAKRADERSDLYAVGSMLYEMLAGRPVLEFSGDWVRDLGRIIEENPAPLRRVQPALPPDVATVVHKALEKDAGRRYPSCAAMSEDLRRILADEPIQARPPSVAYRARKWVLRHRVVSAAAFVALAAGALALGVNLWQTAARRAERRASLARAASALERAAEGDLERVLEEARVAVGAGAEPEARELRKRIYIRSAERWIAQGRHDMALGSLEDARAQFPGESRIAELYRVAEGSGSLTIDTGPPGAEVWLWRQEDLEGAVDEALEARDRRAEVRLRAVLAGMEWREVARLDFRRGKPEGVEVNSGAPEFSDGFRPGARPAVLTLPVRTPGSIRFTIRGRRETAHAWELAGWWHGGPWWPRWFSRVEGRLFGTATPRAEISWEDCRLNAADVPPDVLRPGKAFVIVFEWAFGCGRLRIDGGEVLTAALEGFGSEEEGTGLRAAGEGLVIEEVGVESGTCPDPAEPEAAVDPAVPGATRLGVAPIRSLRLPMGSYLLELRSETRRVRYPVFITRNLAWDAETVRMDRDLPADMVFVPGGPAIVGERRITLPDFAIGRHEVSKAEYWEFLQSLPAAERGPLTPALVMPDGAGGKQGGEDWGFGPFDPVSRPGEVRQPVTYVRVSAAARYCQWLSTKTGRRFRLPTAEEWEKAARGVDGREFPWGRAVHRARANLDGIPLRVADVETCGLGAGPYGALHMAGNVSEWTSSAYRGQSWANVVKGGSYMSIPVAARCASEEMVSNAASREEVGFRVLLELSDGGD